MTFRDDAPLSEGHEQDDASAPVPRAHERLFWRRLAHWGASRGPDWFVRYSPPVFGWAAAALVPSARRAVLRNLRQIRGEASTTRDTRDVLATFGTYASCLAEVLANGGSSVPRPPHAEVIGASFLKQAVDAGRGVVLVTAHTAGWESVGPLLARDYGLRLILVMAPERDAGARRLHDEARRRGGVEIAHVGDPLASLPLLRHLQSGGVVALQLDRAAPGMRKRRAPMFDENGAVPEGPLRLAQVSGAPILPVFCARTGFRKYLIEAFEPVRIARRPTEADLDRAATHLAGSMTRFLRRHPTQWFHFA